MTFAAVRVAIVHMTCSSSWSYAGPCSLLMCLLAACPTPPSSEDTDTASTPTTTTTGESESAGTTSVGATSSGTTSDDEPTAPTSTGTTSTSDTSDTTTTGALTETTSEGGSTTGPGVDTCGDGELDPGELCDDGNVLAGDGCLPDCTPGTGAALPPIELPADGTFRCLTTIDGAVLGDGSHVLALGGWTGDSPVDALVQAFAQPDGQPLPGSFVHDGAFNRFVDQVATAPDGDIVVAGHIDTDAQELAGHLWLARLSPAGEIVWLREHETILTDPEDLALTATDGIVIASRLAGWGPGNKPSWVQVFDEDGEFQWEHAAPASPEWHAWYKGVAIDPDGTIYVVGAGQHMDEPTRPLLLEALAEDGAPLWQIEAASPIHKRAEPSGIVVTVDGMLVVAGTESDTSVEFSGEPGLIAFDKTGANLWWRNLPAPMFWTTWAGWIAAAPGGGVLVAWGTSQEDISRTRIARYNGDGEALWEIESDSQAGPRDAGLGPEEVFYVLEGSSVRPYLP